MAATFGQVFAAKSWDRFSMEAGGINLLSLNSVTGGVLAEELYSFHNGFINPCLPFVWNSVTYRAKGNAVSEADGVSGGTTLSSASYTFTDKDVGKSVWLDGAGPSTITSTSAGVATFTPSLASGSAKQWLVGFDDTDAINAALQLAKNYYGNPGNSGATASYGGVMRGNAVVLPPGGYVISNSSASYSGGKTAAIKMPRRVSFMGMGGSNVTHLYCAGSFYGNVIALENPTGYDDFVRIYGLSLFCNGGWSSMSNQIDGLSIALSPGLSFKKVNAFNRVRDIRIWEPRRIGLYVAGSGEAVYEEIYIYAAQLYGLYMDACYDSWFSQINIGGCYKTGVRCWKAANCHIQNCKSFFNGSTGGTNAADSANFVCSADSTIGGLTYFSNCEAQESRGPSWVIEGGVNIFSHCLAQDPSRRNSQLGADTGRPTIRAGFQLQGNQANRSPSINTFIGCVVQPSVSIFSTPNDNGTHALNIDGGGGSFQATANNRGDIFTYPTAQYQDANNISTYNGSNGAAGAKVGGSGATNGLNTGLRVDGVALT